MRLRDWATIFGVLIVALVGVHQYDGEAAESAASASAGVVYTTQLEQCQGSNPTRAAQRYYFATVAKGRATSAQFADANDPLQRSVDRQIAIVAHATARTYVDRVGALPSGELDCEQVTRQP